MARWDDEELVFTNAKNKCCKKCMFVARSYLDSTCEKYYGLDIKPSDVAFDGAICKFFVRG